MCSVVRRRCRFKAHLIPEFPPEDFGLQGPEAFAYTSMSNCLEVEGINDVQDFAETQVGS